MVEDLSKTDKEDAPLSLKNSDGMICVIKFMLIVLKYFVWNNDEINDL